MSKNVERVALALSGSDDPANVLEIHRYRARKAIEALGGPMTDERIKHMVDRFLRWRLPENFAPDAGISFKAAFNENTPHPMKHEPTGTNLFDAVQAEAMIRYMV